MQGTGDTEISKMKPSPPPVAFPPLPPIDVRTLFRLDWVGPGNLPHLREATALLVSLKS